MSSAPVQQHWSGTVCRLVLDRPAQGNALSPGLVAALDAALDDAAARGATLLVFEGAGRNFCTGFDLSDIADQTDDSLLARFARVELLLQRVHRAPCPTVAVVRGRAIGAGADLFAACTHRLAQRGASFTFPGFRGFGLVLGSRRLAMHVGMALALDWVESARVIDGEEALAAGLSTGRFEGDDALCAARDAVGENASADADSSLRNALDGHAAAHDARDLEALVRSAARVGLQQRVAGYVLRQAQARQASAGAQSAASAAS